MRNAFGGFGVGAGFAVVEDVARSHVAWREVGHHHVGASHYAHCPALWVYRVQCRGARYQGVGEHQPEDAVEPTCEVGAPGGVVPKRCVVLRHKGSQAYHLGLKLLNELYVLDNVVERLPRTPRHDAGANLVAQLFEPHEALQAVLERHLGRVKPAVVLGVMALVAKQVTVGTRLFKSRIHLPGPLAQRQRNGAVVPPLSYLAHQVYKPRRLVAGQLAALQHKGPETQVIALLAALQHLMGGEQVSLHRRVALAYAAVQAVVAAHVGELHQSAHKDTLAKHLVAHLTSLLMQVGNNAFVVTRQQRLVATAVQVTLRTQYVNKFSHATCKITKPQQLLQIFSIKFSN